MKNGIKLGLLVSGIVFAPSVFAEQVQVKPYANLGLQKYEFTIVDPNGPDESETEVADSNYLAVGGGVTVSNGSLYGDLNLSTSVAAELESADGDADFTRYDISFAMGYLLEGGFSVFGGYKIGTSEMSEFSNDASIPDIEFKADGFFIGASQGWNVDETTLLSFSLAAALMKGHYTWENETINKVKVESDSTVGVSAGLSMSKLINDNLSLTGSFKYQSYTYSDFDGEFAGSIFTEELAGLEVDEDILTFGVTLSMHL